MTPRQKQVLEFILAYIKWKGHAPSYANIAEGLQMKSRSNMHKIVHKLEEEGLIYIKPRKFRSMRVPDKTIRQVINL
jgi:hypothetical protein